LESGMIDEVAGLLKGGITPDQLIYYGLEYKYLTEYVTGIISYEEMFTLLNTAIHQFAKRQMTWFRRMERQGMKIWWLDEYDTVEKKRDRIIELMGR
jgi:tRNA dimethylallyltransferase